MMPRRGFAALVLTILLAINPVLVTGQQYYTPSELSVKVYRDGYASVDYLVDVDPTRPRVNVTLFGSHYSDIIVEDQDGLGLDYSTSEDGLSIDTLGSRSVFVYYITQELTSKSGQIWTLRVSSPVDVSILLPPDITLGAFSPFPLSMSDLGENLFILMPGAEIEIPYIIGPVGTREQAVAVINDAEATIDGIKADGIIVDEAEALLQAAQDALTGELYAEAEQLAEDAKDSALDIQAQAGSASIEITQAGDAIDAASDVGRVVGIDEANNLLQQAEDAFDVGDYAEAEGLAREASTAAAEATKEGGLPIVWLGTGALLIALAAGAFLMTRRGGDKKTVESQAKFDLDRLFEEHSHLRLDDKEVLRFLAESGGEVFAAELRERFNVPRTSLWRMIRRLEKEEVVEVSIIGGQSLVKISQNYREGGA